MNNVSLSRQLPEISVEDAISEFLLHQRASRHSTKTIENHSQTLNRFKAWLPKTGCLVLSDINASQLREYFLELQESTTQYGRQPSSYTVFTHFKNLRAFFHFHEVEESICTNPMRRLSPPRIDKKILPAFDDDEIKRLLAVSSGTDETAVRNRALLCFMLDSGCRLAEVVNLRVGDVDRQTGLVRIQNGKGGKDRVTKIGSKSLLLLCKYLRRRHQTQSDALWQGSQGALTRDGIKMILRRTGWKAGVHANPHKFRRTMALSMLRAGCDIYSLQLLLGHSELDVLRRYLAQTETDLRRAHERYSPVDNMK